MRPHPSSAHTPSSGTALKASATYATTPPNPVGLVLGMMITGTASLMLLPAIVDLSDGNADWIAFALSAASAGFVGIGIVFAMRFKGHPQLTMKRAFILTVAAWLLVPGVSALPLMGLGLSYTDAFFETMSGMTTTGSTVLTGLDALPRGILLWRALLQWIGGVGIVVMAILLLPLLRVGGMQLFLTESSDTSEKAIASAQKLVEHLLIVYLLLTVACALLFYHFGMSGFDAICHAMTTLSTGGFSTHDASFSFFENPALHWIAIVFMFAGSCPFIVFIKAMRGDRRAMFTHPEVRLMFLILAVSSVIMAYWLSGAMQLPFLQSLRLTAFNITSIVTTTGFASTDYSLWGPQVAGAFFLLTFVGGCTGSTTGAVKMYRHLVVGKMMVRQVKLLANPRQVIPLSYGGRRINEEIVSSVVAFLVAYFATFALASLLLTATGLDLVTALTGAATALGNVGPGLGHIVGPSGNFSSLPDLSKWVLSIAMMLGRLEMLAVLVLFAPGFWR